MKMLHWWPVYVGLGSNLDDPGKQVTRATEALGKLPDTILVSQSGRYRSAPFGPVEQPDFVNSVVGLLTRLNVREMLTQMQQIELEQDRKPGGERWGPRKIDLDLLAYNGQTVNDDDLIVPHPGIARRNFVLLPWQEIAPSFRVPGLKEVAVLAANVSLSEPRIERIG